MATVFLGTTGLGLQPADIRRRIHEYLIQAGCSASEDPIMLAFLRTTPRASTTAHASGTFSIGMSLQTPTVEAGSAILPFVFAETITGTVSGRRVGSGTLILNPDGSVQARHTGTFTGKIGGLVGTATVRIKAWGTLSDLKARFMFSDGTDGLKAVHAYGTLVGGVIAATKTGDPIIAGSYTGSVRLD